MMQFTRFPAIGLACLLSLYLTADIAAQTPEKSDNTRVNKQNQDATADKQSNNAADRELARKVRHSVYADKSLSGYAHNIKIIAQDGTVTLKGPVRTEDEKSSVEAKAKEIAGADKVVNQLTVAPRSGGDSK